MKVRTIGIIAVAVAITAAAATYVFGQDIPPAMCGTGWNPEPGQDPQCSTGAGCDVFRICADQHIRYGDKKTYCCYYDPQGRCVQVWGQWECCSTDGGTWKKECRIVSRSAGQICSGQHCVLP